MIKLSKPKSTFFILTFLVGLGCLILFFFSLGKKDAEHFLTEKAILRDIRKIVVATGTIAPAQIVEVGAQASGQIKNIHVKLGQTVKQGDLIAEIDSTTQMNDLNTQKAQLNTYTAQLQSRQVSLQIAQRRYNRESSLRTQDATSRENFENAEDALAKAKADLTEIQSLIEQTKIAVSTAEANLGYTLINAPFDGVVVAIPVEIGQTVNANQTTPTIVKLADLSYMEVKIQISEGDITSIIPGMSVVFSILSAPHKQFESTIAAIDPGDTILTDSKDSSVASSDKSAVYYYGRMLVPNPDGLLRNAMTTQCTIVVAEAANVLAIPTFAIQDKNGGKYVIILRKDGHIEEKEIIIGLSDTMYTQVLSGLQEGDAIVTVRMTDDEIQKNIEKF